MKRGILFVIGILLVGFVNAADHYISPSGHNSNGGRSCGDAYLTFSYSQSQISAGDTLYLCDGIYKGGKTGTLIVTKGGSPGNPITFKPE